MASFYTGIDLSRRVSEHVPRAPFSRPPPICAAHGSRGADSLSSSLFIMTDDGYLELDDPTAFDTDGVYHAGPREKKDSRWGWTYAAVLVSTLACGAVASARADPHYDALTDPELMRRASHCAARSPSADATYRRSLVASSGDESDDTAFVREDLPWVVGTLAGALVVGVAFLALFRVAARTATYGVVAVKLVAVATLGFTLALRASSPAWSVLVLLVVAIYAVCLYLWRREIDLVARLLAAAAQSIHDNPHIISAVVALKLALVAVLVPIFALAVRAGRVGELARDPDVVLVAGDACASSRDEQNTDPVDCCVWRSDDWYPSYVALACFAALWTIMLAFEARVFIVSDVVAQWYFSPPTRREYAGATSIAASHAFGSSFGSLALGSLVLSIVAILREANRRVRENMNRHGSGVSRVAACVVAACAECVFALVSFVSKFATIRMAITGDGFCDAASDVSALLARNFMSSYGVWWLPGFILSAAVALVAAAYGTLVGFAHYAAGSAAAAAKEHPGDDAFLFGIVACVLAWIVLRFCARVLLDVVDATYVCYASDLDRGADVGAWSGSDASKKIACATVFEEVRERRGGGARVGEVVRGPDGGLAYAAPNEVDGNV